MYEPSMPQLMKICPTQYRLKERSLPLAVSERPELFVERAIAQPLIVGKPKAVILQIRNRGKRTAYNVAVGVNQAGTPPSFVGPLQYTFVEPDTKPDLGPDAIISLVTKGGPVVTEEEIGALDEGEVLWFHFGKARYEDESGRTYWFDFCFIYEPVIGRDMRICPTCYWPPEERA